MVYCLLNQICDASSYLELLWEKYGIFSACVELVTLYFMYFSIPAYV